MPKYELTKTSYIDQPDPRDPSGFAPKLVKAGTKVSYDGWPGSSFDPLDAEAKRRAEIVAEFRANGQKLPATVTEYDKAQAKVAKAEKSTAKAA